ncbi:LysR family transcriptional regulator [Sinorhizobium alkalisoli]|uniref:LysR family transcriptional regulator n=1 Tax=Sinorhizobium alkalisoli TaxID=1752398 RepID=A0A1E3VCH6_9HYPH|nr:LysR family transcriptional regulator [Sinorhizobium alkalisoli]MCA1494528.1 LysR family transcriptional regulator [Ensifer sp. NBAIM29]MCG5480261.1 LysR family transcriptional regulator [Sinorhizobium alkalisoli]ODR91283.1 LysR family transcriptional regulator [Sinorhizobium alkalisoli]QFI66636.1 Transcriptional regulator, LysR family [Sinorhizobium alkalisoli]
MNTDDVLVFIAAVAGGSLAAAARRLGLTPMVASRRLAALEATLGVRLLHRTTRSLSLTPEGETFLPFAQALIENEAAAMARLRSESLGAAGLLRVSVPISFGLKFVMPFVPSLLQENPELRISVDLTDSLPDLVATGADLAIRIARLRDSSLIAQKLAANLRMLVASPDYVARRGKPRLVAELADHDCLALGAATHWTFRAPDGDRHARLNVRLACSSIAGCHAASLAGGGVALLSNWYAEEDIAAGRLVRINLDDARPEPINIWAVYPTTQLVLPKVRVFIAALRAAMEDAGIRNTAE